MLSMVATLQSNEIGNGMNVLSFLLKQTITFNLFYSDSWKITIFFVERKKKYRTSNKSTKIGREMKERQMNTCMTFLEIISDVVQKGPTAKRFRSGMFGVSALPIYRSRKRDKLDDFDGIRSILSHRYIILAHGYISCLLFLSCPYCVICRSLPRCVCLRVDK